MARPTDSRPRSTSARPAAGRPAAGRPAPSRPAAAPAPAGERSRPSPQKGKPRQALPVPPAPDRLPTWTGVTSLVLRPGTATPPLAGHPWVFSGALAHVVAGPGASDAAGSPCALFDQHARYLGAGYYNKNSQIAVRIIAMGSDGLEPAEFPALAGLVVQRVRSAVALRRELGLPGAATTAFRLLNSEGDWLPGLTADRYADGAVLQVSTAGAWNLREVVVRELKALGCTWVLVRVPADIHPSEGLLGGSSEEHGEVPEAVTVLHNGLQLQVEPAGGQKTGMYCDQRDNHARVAQLAAGRFVVDAFCHAGGFGLHASRAGAKRVLCVDASQRAVDLTLLHAEKNALRIEVQCNDAVLVLRGLAGLPEAERPDLVIVDPPKYATRAAAVEQALRKYTALNAVAMQAVKPGGWLVSCSCSGLVEPEMFLRSLGQAAQQAGVAVQLVEFRGAAADHPSAPAHAEGRYLKVAICRVVSRS